MSEPKRVMIVGSFAPSLINFRGPLIADMIACGHAVVAAAPKMDQATASALRALGAEPCELPLRNVSLSPAELLASVRALRALIRKANPDVLIAYTIKPVIVAALAGKAERVPTIVSLITGAGYPFGAGRELKRLVSRAAAMFLYRLAFARSDVVIFQNPDDERDFRRWGMVPETTKTAVVNGSGVDLAHFSPAPLPRQPAFLMIARLVRDKGIYEFAGAARRLKAAHNEVKIALVGPLDPSPNAMTAREVHDLLGDAVEYKGALADVRPAIADCSVYVLPSAYREGTPRSVLEAMAMGRAIVTTDMPGCRETVEEGQNGFLIPPRDPDALHRAMLRFVEQPDLAARMGTQSRALAEERYDVHSVNSALLRYAGLSC